MKELAEVVAGIDPAVAAHAVADPGPARFAGRGLTPERELVLETVWEGHLFHYGEPRAAAGMDPDLRLLAGDALYAHGLEQLAARGDVDAVAALAELISASSRAQAEGRGAEVPQLWEAAVAGLAEEA